MLEILAQLAAAATPGEPVDWRHVTWPAHDTATMRALLDNNLVHPRRACHAGWRGLAACAPESTVARATGPRAGTGGRAGDPARLAPPPHPKPGGNARFYCDNYS